MFDRGSRSGWWAPLLALLIVAGVFVTTTVDRADARSNASRTVAASAADGPRAVAVLPTAQDRVVAIDVSILGAGFLALLLASRWLGAPDDRIDHRSIRFVGAVWRRRGPPLDLSH